MNAQSVIGTWRLESFKHETADRSVDYPFGRNPVGRLMYGLGTRKRRVASLQGDEFG